jgi:mono/diheme cytochrome c family protein
MPNISPDQADGIGGWTTAQFVRAMREGVSAHGENEYPAFPYTSFQRMTANDLRDLFTFIKTLPAVAGKARDHDLKFPFTMRRGVGLWKLVFLDGEPLVADPKRSPAWNRGRYLVEGPGHCAECHSPRNLAGAIISNKRFSGAPDPEGHGYVPNITQDDTGIGYWSQREIDDYLSTGLTPINTQAGESMAAVVANLAHLSPDDRADMAEYIKSLPAIDAPNAGAPPLNRTPTIRMLPVASGDKKSPTSALAAPADALAQANTLYTVATKPFFLDRRGQPDWRRRWQTAPGRKTRGGGARRRLAAGAGRWLAAGRIAGRARRLKRSKNFGSRARPDGGGESQARPGCRGCGNQAEVVPRQPHSMDQQGQPESRHCEDLDLQQQPLRLVMRRLSCTASHR